MQKHSPIKNSKHRSIIRGAWILLLGVALLSMFSHSQLATIAQDSETTHSSEEQVSTERALQSVAACPQVTYGSLNNIIEQDVSPEIPHFVVPPNAEGPVLVDIGIFVKGFSEIDPVHNVFVVEGFIDMIWCDPREGFDPEELGWHEKIFLEDDAESELQLIWWPDITFPNQSGSRDTENLELLIFEDGTVEYEERFSVTLEANFDLRLFPFDTQHLEIQVESLAWSEDYLIFHEEENMIGFSSEFQLPEWEWNPDVDLTTRVESVQELRDQHPFSEFVVDLTVHRRPDFYLLKVFLPMALIVALSWAVFWMDESDLGDRLSISFTGLLTVVAYQFILGDTLPHLSYLTFMDVLINYSFVMMALTVVENVLVHILRTEERRMKVALRVDQSSRLIFPMIYFIGLVAIVVAFVGV